MNKAIIVGCGLSGITAAIVLRERGYDVEIFETRNHIGGNCFDSFLNNILVHNYGPHIFHTDDEEVFAFLSRYTEWTPFYLRPKGRTKLGLISLPYSKKTISEIGRELSPEEIQEYLFKDYSEKQWGVPFDMIPQTILKRIPTTASCSDPTWFDGQKYQCIPKFGYTEMMKNMLDGIKVNLGVSRDFWKDIKYDLMVYTGKIDEFFSFCHGHLPYRSLDFSHHVSPFRLGTFIINQNIKNIPYTREYDHGYLNGDFIGSTIITREYPKYCGEHDVPFYPIPFGCHIKIVDSYKLMVEKSKNVIFLGRLANYKYLDMWMAVKLALSKLRNV